MEQRESKRTLHLLLLAVAAVLVVGIAMFAPTQAHAASSYVGTYRAEDGWNAEYNGGQGAPASIVDVMVTSCKGSKITFKASQSYSAFSTFAYYIELNQITVTLKNNVANFNWTSVNGSKGVGVIKLVSPNQIDIKLNTTKVNIMGDMTGPDHQVFRHCMRIGGSTSAGNWKRADGKWLYQWSNGAYAANQWDKIGGKWYYFSGQGYMQTGWLRDGGKWYYLGSDGAMRTGWYKVGKKWYYSNASGAMQANKWVGNYYLTKSGAMATNTWIGKYHVNASGLWDKTR